MTGCGTENPLNSRTAGILLPISSLPSPGGIGTLGRQAFAFIDFLKSAGQRYWQILPIGPTGCGDSPYQSFSAFAYNPYFIDLEELTNEGLLRPGEAESFRFGDDPRLVDYGALYQSRFTLLHLAASRFPQDDAGYRAFTRANAQWLEDYALFMALKQENGMVSVLQWPEELRKREETAMAAARERLTGEIAFWKTVQYLFWRQWAALKKYAHRRGIRIIGDIPIYVSPDSSDFWAQPELFRTDEDGKPTEVAGCPPDAFTAKGQLWGNPLYAWEKHAETGFVWWKKRLAAAGTVYDVVRIDHFRGFESYYAIKAGRKDAVRGRWRKGPGIRFVRAIQKELPNLHVIAEDLGFLTPAVEKLLAKSGFPGMKVLQFAFDSDDNPYLPYRCTANSVVYTGTHDNPTTEEWHDSAPAEQVSFAKKYVAAAPGESFSRCMIRTAMASPSSTCVIPMQDWLGLGADARMNIPGTAFGNWRWRLVPEDPLAELAPQIYEMTKTYGRFLKPKKTK